MSGIIRKAVMPVVGLGAEAYAHHKNKKREAVHPHQVQGPTPQQSSQSQQEPLYEAFDDNPPPYEPAADAESDEEDWQADEAGPPTQNVSCVPKGKAGGPASIDDIVKAFLATYPARPTGNGLPCPVIIPQKRPGEKTRGFVHAYAPALDAIGIDERTWMDFMQCFEESIRVSPAFNAINVGANVVGLAGMAIPSPAIQAATTAITVADKTAQAVYQRARYNDFLAQLNEKYFRHFGLFAMIMTYDPNSSSLSQSFDLSSTIAKAEHNADASGVKLKFKNVKGVTGTTHGHNQMPQAAELVFPAIDRPDDEGWWKRTNRFVGDYMDRRAQAHYANINPNSALSTQPQFESQHGAVGIAGLTFRERRQQRMDAYSGGGVRAYGRRARHQITSGYQENGTPPPPPASGRGMRVRRRGGGGGPVSLLVTAASGGKLQGKDARPISIVRRTLKPGVMYLMVTPRPSEEQLAAAREMLELH